ncbi:MAG: restriction endonuclease subunit S [Desulfomonilaceae bacterium]
MKSGWQVKTLGEISLFENGDRGKNYPSKSVQTNSGIPFINAGHLTDFGIDYGTMNYIPRERFDLLGNGKIRKGDILFCLRGSLGKFASVGELSEGSIASSLVIIRPGELVLNKYVLAYLQSDLCSEMINKFKNGAAQPNLSAGSLKKFIIPLPPLPEQQRIVGILDEAFAGIATAKTNAEKNLQNARTLFESHLGRVFTQRGDGWTEKVFSDVCEISSTLVDPRIPEHQELPHVGGANIETKTGGLINLKTANEEGLKSGKFLFDETMVLYSKIRPYLMKVARPDFKGLCSADIYPLSAKRGQLNRDFLFHLLLAPEFTEYAIAGSARAGMPKVNRSHLFAYRIRLPPLIEQKHYAEQLDMLHGATQRLEYLYNRKLAALDELKKSLLHQAFSGQL